jgi:hypothetical protein
MESKMLLLKPILFEKAKATPVCIDNSRVPGYRNWHIETAAWIWPVSYYVL